MTKINASNPTITEAMRSLREQVVEAVTAADGQVLMFRLEEVEVELQVALTVTVSAEARVSVWTVITAGFGAEVASSDTHRLKLRLTPRRTDGAHTQIAGNW